jgi:hypothetical protein
VSSCLSFFFEKNNNNPIHFAAIKTAVEILGEEGRREGSYPLPGLLDSLHYNLN